MQGPRRADLKEVVLVVDVERTRIVRTCCFDLRMHVKICVPPRAPSRTRKVFTHGQLASPSYIVRTTQRPYG